MLGAHTLGSTFVLCRYPESILSERDYLPGLGVVMAVGISWTVYKIIGRYSIFNRTLLVISYRKLRSG